MAAGLPESIRLLASDQPGEVFAAAKAMQRLLARSGKDFHDLAAAVENIEAYVAKQIAANLPTEPEWKDVAKAPKINAEAVARIAFLMQRLADLRARERDFVKSLAERHKQWGNKMYLSEKQAAWLQSLREQF